MFINKKKCNYSLLFRVHSDPLNNIIRGIFWFELVNSEINIKKYLFLMISSC